MSGLNMGVGKTMLARNHFSLLLSWSGRLSHAKHMVSRCLLPSVSAMAGQGDLLADMVFSFIFLEREQYTIKRAERSINCITLVKRSFLFVHFNRTVNEAV